MSSEIQHIKSISQLHAMLGFEKPTHPLVSIVDVSKWQIGPEWIGKKSKSDLYSIALKDSSCGMEYGRNTYDFNEGVLIFTAPDQVVAATKEQKLGEIQGWMLFFHKDLIRNTELGARIDDYGFFSYDVHEALHLSEAEQNVFNDCIKLLSAEIGERIDGHSQRVIVNTIELLLNYGLRFYERQFHTRSNQHSDVVSQFESVLKEYYKRGGFSEDGIPSVDLFADEIHLSPNYLSDLLKKETGMAIKDHINHFVVEKAKNLLLSDTDTISGVAYKLGFNYPHYFSRLFKSKTGLTPNQYRNDALLN